MSQTAVARGTIERARYFLSQAENAERDPNISGARLPYIANLEAAIIYTRSALDHLSNEFAGKPGYRHWNDNEWERLKTFPVFVFLTERRGWIVHRAAEKVNLALSASVPMVASARMICDAVVIRGQPWYKRPLKILWQDWMDGLSAWIRLRKEPVQEELMREIPTPAQTQPEQIFYFEDTQWKSKPARVFVGEYIDLLEQVVTEAERKFV